MTSENVIHIKLNYNEALQSKKDILSTEADLLRVLKAIKNFHALRSEELKTKMKLAKQIMIMSQNLTQLKKILPKIKIPENLRHLHQQESEYTKEPKIEKKIELTKAKLYDEDLEQQLKDIQNKLRKL